MSRRSRRRRAEGSRGASPTAPATDYADAEGNVLTLRGSLTPKTRLAYEDVLRGSPLSQEDAWHRAVELLFERLAVRWVIAGVPVARQRELLARFRVASPGERAWVRDVLRRHLAEHFPEMDAP